MKHPSPRQRCRAIIVLLLLLQSAPLYATQRLPLSHRTSVAQRPIKEASNSSSSHIWKFSLLGLAGLSFLIRKRL